MEPQDGLQETPRPRIRRRFTREEKRAITERYRAGGLSQVKFAQSEGIAVVTLRRWLSQDEDYGGTNGSSAVELGRLGHLGGSREWAEIVRPDGWRVRLCGACDAERLRSLFSSLPPCSN